METWDAHLTGELAITVDPGGEEEPFSGSTDFGASGQFTSATLQLQSSVDVFGTAGIFLAAPQDRVSAVSIVTGVTNYETTPVFSYFRQTVQTTTPAITLNYQTDINLSIAIDIKEGDGEPTLGDASAFANITSFLWLGLIQVDPPVKVWVKSDGTVSVFIRISANFEYNFATGIFSLVRFLPSTYSGDSVDVTINLLGETVAAKLLVFSGSGTATIDTFSFEYRVDSSTQYSYPVSP